MYQNDPMKVLTGEVRLSYANLTTPRAAQQGGEPKYSVTLLIPKTDVKTKADIDAAINAAANEALTKVWNGARPPQLAIGTPRDYAMSEIKRRITEALTQDDRITGVDDWSFETSGRGVRAKFTVNTIYGDLTAEKEVEI